MQSVHRTTHDGIPRGQPRSGRSSSEGVFEQLDLGRATALEPARIATLATSNRTESGPTPWVSRKTSAKEPQLPTLPRVDGLETDPPQGTPSRLDLAEHEHVAPTEHEVDLAETASPVARDEREPAAPVEIERGLFTAGAETRCAGRAWVETVRPRV